MLVKNALDYGKEESEIRKLFEYGKKRKAEIGAENVFDFSIGNPSVPAPKSVDESIKKLVDNMDSVALHGYTSAAGDLEVRAKIADFVNEKYNAGISAENIYMTCGAAAGIAIVLNAIVNPGEECIVFTPYFPEYKVFLEKTGGKLVEVKSDDNLQIDLDAFEAAITEKTRAVIINSPNNPSGVVYPAEKIQGLSDILNKKQEEYGHPIYIVTDEPYRPLVYDDIEVPYVTNYYDNTFVTYSFSKALSLPGDRIGYIIVSPKMKDSADAFAAIAGSGRMLGYVCAPSVFQRVVADNVDVTSDISIYKKNRDLLYNALTEMGYECVHPDGAFYLFVKTKGDSREFCEKAKKYELLLVPADSFGTPGYMRVSYCVDTAMIEKALPAFEKLINEE